MIGDSSLTFKPERKLVTFCLGRYLPRQKGTVSSVAYDRALLHTAALIRGIENPSQLARETGLSGPTAWRIWNGIGAPRGDHADRVADAVGISASHLYTRTKAGAAA